MKTYDVVGIGSALVDLTAQVSDQQLAEIGLEKGSMTLVEAQDIKDIVDTLTDTAVHYSAGGSAANTLAGLARLGGRGALMARVGDDHLAELYHQQTKSSGTHALFASDDGNTGHALTLITPDGERTFATHLGSAIMFDTNDVETDAIAHASILHLEGYQLEGPGTRAALEHAASHARKHNTLVSIDLADAGLIERCFDIVESFVKNHADIVFANETEATAFTGLPEHQAIDHLAGQCQTAIVKLGENGSLIRHTDTATHAVPVHNVTMVNSNGAGDMYAAGVLYGLTQNLSTEQIGRLASWAAAQVVATEPARIDRDLSAELQHII